MERFEVVVVVAYVGVAFRAVGHGHEEGRAICFQMNHLA